jgi:hypothetical protein
MRPVSQQERNLGGPPKRPWQRRENWVQAAKALVTLVPAIAIYSFIGTRGLEALCTQGRSRWLCNGAFVAYVIVAVAIARLFFLWLAPRSREKSKEDSDEY